MNIKISIEHDHNQIPVVGKLLCHLCAIAEVEYHPSVNKIELAVVELLNNIVNYSGVDSVKELIEVKCQFENSAFNITVSAPGAELSAAVAREYSNGNVRMPTIDTVVEELPESGWGIQLIKSVCDSIEYSRIRDKNVYQLEFDLSVEAVC